MPKFEPQLIELLFHGGYTMKYTQFFQPILSPATIVNERRVHRRHISFDTDYAWSFIEQQQRVPSASELSFLHLAV